MKNIKWMRVAILWRDTIIAESLVDNRRPVTLGAHPKNTLVVPDLADVGDTHLLFAPDVNGFTLLPTDAMEGRLTLADAEETDLAAVRRLRGTAIAVGGRDWGLLDLADGVSVFFQCTSPPDRAPRRTVWGTLESSMLAALLGAVVLHLGLLVAAFLFWDQQPQFSVLDMANRFPIVFYEQPPEEIEQPEVEEPVTDDESPAIADDPGTFGEPEKQEESKVSKADADIVNKVMEVGVHRALGSDLLARGPLSSVMGDKQGFVDKLNAAAAGPDGSMVVGRGTGGAALRGTGKGGGGNGFGRVRSMGKGPGTGRGTKAGLKGRTARKAPGTVRVRPPNVGVYCKESDIVRVVQARKRGVQYCYEKALARDAELAGKVTLSWRITLDGKVAVPRVEDSTLRNAEVRKCMVRAVKRWQFPKPEGGMCQVRFPFVFSPGQ